MMRANACKRKISLSGLQLDKLKINVNQSETRSKPESKNINMSGQSRISQTEKKKLSKKHKISCCFFFK